MKRIIENLLRAFLAGVMGFALLLSLAACTEKRDNNTTAAESTTNSAEKTTIAEEPKFDTITLGSYPQQKVTDSAIKAALNLNKLSADLTVSYGGSKYKKVILTEDSNGFKKNTVYWFKIEPIKWRVLSNTEGILFVMAEKILDNKVYNSISAPTTWETSSLRSWLNNDFYNAVFTSVEKALINESVVVNEDNPILSTEGGNDTKDKLFVLSFSEAILAFNDGGLVSSSPNSLLQAKGTDYSKSQGIWVETYAGDPNIGYSVWWLRTVGNTESKGSVVGADGVPDCTHSAIIDEAFGIRPAFNINASSVVVTRGIAE
ncbi:MAG: DUF6273 domain-containing protein [Eubacteriales bacterium]